MRSPISRATRIIRAGSTGWPGGVVGEHVGESDQGRFAVELVAVVALDRAREPAGQPPAAGEDAADERVVDSELAALAVDALLRRLRVAVDLLGVAGVGVDEHELADVVQQRGDEQLVALLEADLARKPLGRPLGGDGVQAEALRRGIPAGDALEEVECRRAGGERLDARRRDAPRRRAARSRSSASWQRWVRFAIRKTAITERHVRLDRGYDVARGGVVLADEPQDAVARLGERGKGLERFEGGRQPSAVALVLARRLRRRGPSRPWDRRQCRF